MLRLAVHGCFRKLPKSDHGLCSGQRYVRLSCSQISSKAEWKQSDKLQVQGISEHFLDQNVKIRTATLSDYFSVIDIIRNGPKKRFDNLTNEYCRFISSKSCAGYIANVHGEDVGILLTRVIDDGTNVFLDEFRTKDGVDESTQATVLQHVLNNLNTNTRTITRSTYCDTLSNLLQDFKWQPLTKKIRGTFYTSLPELLAQLRSHCVKILTTARLTRSELRKMIKTCSLPQDHSKSYILKSGVLYRPMLQNVDLVVDKRALALITNAKDTDHSLISFGTYSFTTNGLHCNLSFHGNMQYDLDEHVYLHLSSVLNRNHGVGQISFEVFSDEWAGNQLIENVAQYLNVNVEKDTVTWYQSRLL